MRTALLSCLHANLEATTAVLENIRKIGIDRVICLGDLVGYGGDPLHVVEASYPFDVVLTGDHDEGIVHGPDGFDPIVRESIVVARSMIRPGVFADARKKQAWNFMKSLPVWFQEGGTSYMHASPRHPTKEYILRTDCQDLFGAPTKKLQSIFRKIERICFTGHTHDPGVVTENGEFQRPSDFGSIFRFQNGRKYLVNVGSVGQPRDGDPRACYAIFDERSVEFRRVDYDVERAMEKSFGRDPEPPTAGVTAKRRWPRK